MRYVNCKWLAIISTSVLCVRAMKWHSALLPCDHGVVSRQDSLSSYVALVLCHGHVILIV